MNSPIMKVITQRAFTSSFEPIRVKIGLAVSATQNMIIAANNLNLLIIKFNLRLPVPYG